LEAQPWKGVLPALQKTRLQRAKHQMPDGVHQGMEDGGSENAIRFPPRATVKDSRYRREQGVTPVWKDSVIRDMSQAENY
jgi:hypothetical protein